MGNKPKLFNPARRVANNCWIGALVGVALFVFSITFPIDTYGANYALTFASIIVFFTSLISGIVFARLAGKVDAMVSGDGLLAHWTYAPEFWARYTEAEHLRDRSDKWSLFRLVAIITIVVCGLFVAFKHDEAAVKTVLIVVPGLIALIAVVAWASIAWSYTQNRRHPGDAYISKSGALIGRAWHYWKIPLSFVHSVDYHEGDEPYVEIDYSAQSGMARGSYTARIPVPPGHEEEARNVVKALGG